MQKVFRFVKKKRNLRRLSVVWLCLVIIELFCPVFCDEPTFATANSPQTTINYTITQTENTSENFLSACDHQNTSNEGTVCNDECLCHAMAALTVNIVSFKESFIRSEQIAFSYGKPVFNSLPPPYLPPKNS